MSVAMSVLHERLGSSSTMAISFLVVSTIAFLLLSLYRKALPKPISGIPYLEASSRKVFGDVPAMIKHIARENGTFSTYMFNVLHQLDAPLVQVFIKPFCPPLLVLADFGVAQELMTRRADFDRSTSSGDLVRGLAPDHHVHMKTTAIWKSQRRLSQDLMTPAFLHHVAGPVIHQKFSLMIELWRVKSRIADGRPWSAAADVDRVTLDGVVGFAFGEGFQHSATVPYLEAVHSLSDGEIASLRNSGGRDDPVIFPDVKPDAVLKAIRDLTNQVKEVQGSPLPDLKWAYVLNKPSIRRAVATKEKCVTEEIKRAVAWVESARSGAARSATEHMIERERYFAEKEGRKPSYFSRVMMDEVFGFVVAGHDTTATSVAWAVKFLASNPAAQTQLRKILHSAFPAARAAGRDPSIAEITSTNVPYVLAVMEEVMRCSGTVPVVDRQASVDTELLGHRIPKGTVVSCLVLGPSMTSPGFDMEREKMRRASYDDAKQLEAGPEVRAWDSNDIAAFKPERWLAKNGPGATEQFDGAAGPQIAFGLGLRQCPGKRLANLELRIALILVTWNFELQPLPAELSSYHPVLMMANKPRYCYVRLRELDHASP